LGKELENLDSEKELLLPQYLSISGVLPEPVLEKIKKIPGIESADSSVDRYPHILNAFETLKKMTQVLLLGLSLALLILLTQLAQLNATTQQESLSLLKLMGAGTFSQRFPPLLSGLWTGLLGGLIAAMGWWLSGTLLIDRFQLLSPGLKQMPQPPWEMGVILLGVGMVFGIFSGLFSGAFAQSK
jgi:cell division protein FtsX